MVVSGCGLFQQANEQDISNKRGNNNTEFVRVKNSAPQTNNIDRKEGQKIANHLVRIATKNQDVNDATAVVIGDYAIVGIDVDENLERSKVGTIKYSVAESLKQDPYGSRAIIIADADMNARLNEVADDIKSNRPIQGIMNELADITGRLMPEIPGDIMEPAPENAPEKQKQQLNQNEKQQLDNKQQEQSHNQKNKNERK